MSYRQKNFNNHSAMSNKILYRGSINSSLINISKQLNNISINDINILKLKREKNTPVLHILIHFHLLMKFLILIIVFAVLNLFLF